MAVLQVRSSPGGDSRQPAYPVIALMPPASRRELAEFAGLPPPEPMVEAIYRDVGAARKRSPLRYREREYGMDVEGRQWWVTDEEGVTATLAAPGEGGARPLV